jgi:hypothetical protein
MALIGASAAKQKQNGWKAYLTDNNESCSAWASWSPSECVVNPNYMLVQC